GALEDDEEQREERPGEHPALDVPHGGLATKDGSDEEDDGSGGDGDGEEGGRRRERRSDLPGDDTGTPRLERERHGKGALRELGRHGEDREDRHEHREPH